MVYSHGDRPPSPSAGSSTRNVPDRTGMRPVMIAGARQVCTGGLDVIVIEADAFIGELVDARRRRCAAIHPEIAPADVIHKDEDDVGLPLRVVRRLGRLCRRP